MLSGLQFQVTLFTLLRVSYSEATGNPMDVEALYQKYGPMVLRRCRQLLRDEDEALDVVQDVFV